MRPQYGECDIYLGDTVQVCPSLDVWMRGAKYGKVHRVQGDMCAIRMSHPGVKRLVWTTKDKLQLVERATK